jgi:hypothetical protein
MRALACSMTAASTFSSYASPRKSRSATASSAASGERRCAASQARAMPRTSRAKTLKNGCPLPV